MIPFDVVSLFTNVPLQQTSNVILRKIYDEHLITTKIKCKNMKEVLLLCTKGVHLYLIMKCIMIHCIIY